MALTWINRGILGNSALRFSLRAIVSALLAFWIAQAIDAPLHGLWAVLTAIVVLQMSAGGSIRATLEYVMGTFAGALYASLVSVLIPHHTPLATGAVLALAIGPLAYVAARIPRFRVAPFTAAIVLLLAGQYGQGTIATSLTRLLEVALGGVVAVAVSLLVFADPAHGLGRRQAVVALRSLANALPVFLSGLGRKADPETISKLQGQVGSAVAVYATTVADAEHERRFRLWAYGDPGPLSRTLLRLRHDLVIIARTAIEPLPPTIAEQLLPIVVEAGARVSEQLNACADALDRREVPPPLERVAGALDACAEEIAAIRSEGVTRALTGSEVEQFFALGFALEELRANLVDLDHRVRDWARF